MKKLLSYITAAALSLSLTGCMDIEPVSTITDANYWKNPDQVQAFNQGLSSWMRSYADKYIVWGEMRSNIYSGTSFSGEAPQGYDRLWNNTLEKSSAVVGNYGGLYTGINQINLMIDKVNEAGYLTDAEKTNYLAGAYGMRAFLYFQLLRTYGDVIVYLQHTEGKTIDLGKVARKQDAAADVMKQIKADILASETAYNITISSPMVVLIGRLLQRRCSRARFTCGVESRWVVVLPTIRLRLQLIKMFKIMRM